MCIPCPSPTPSKKFGTSHNTPVTPGYGATYKAATRAVFSTSRKRAYDSKYEYSCDHYLRPGVLHLLPLQHNSARVYEGRQCCTNVAIRYRGSYRRGEGGEKSLPSGAPDLRYD